MRGEIAFYLLACRICDGEVPIPFDSAKERGKWAAEHTAGTGHDSWWVYDLPRIGPIEPSPRIDHNE